MRECRKCNKPFEGHPAQHYCGDPCISPTHERLMRQPTPCRVCSKDTGHASRAYCSVECEPKKSRKPKPRPLTRLCSCGAEWKPSNRQVQTQLCPRCREDERLHYIYTTEKKWRQAVKARAKGVCESCGATEADTGHYHHAHHIKPRSEGGMNTLANGELLCIDCHDSAHGGGVVGGTPLGLTDADVERIASRVVELLREQTIQVPLVNTPRG